MKTVFLKFLLFGLISFQLCSQELLPFVENYSKSNYQGDNQIWNVAQGTDKAIYFANNHYLLRYDGVKCEKYLLPNKTIIRSIMVDGDKIYSGSYKEFGYWVRKEGKMIYTSISNSTTVFDEKENEEIWKIFKIQNTIYFQSFNGIFLYDGNKIKKTPLPFLISYCFVIDNQYCIANPNKWAGYSDKCWGLTASYTRNSDGSTGYTAHQPLNDPGVISPTAALSSFPYTPVESMKFLLYLYNEKKSTLVGVAGPYDAFSPQYNWVTPRYLAIDQGTIAPMIENHRTGLIWNLFMQTPEVRVGLKKLGFSSTQHNF